MDKARRRLFDDLFDNYSMLVGKNHVTLYDAKQQLTRYSPAIVERIGLPGEYIRDGVYDWGQHIHPEDRSLYESTMEDLVAGRQLTYDLSYRVRLRDGSYDRFRLVGGVIRSEDGYAGFVGGTMVSEGMTSDTDHVTLIPSQSAFFDDLMKPGGRTYAALLVGFGRLAHINETYGYGYGNEVLKRVAQQLCALVGTEDRVYRMEGSKFAVVSERRSQREMETLYGKIQDRFRSGIGAEGVLSNLIAYGGVMTVEASDEASGRTVYACLLHAYHESKNSRRGGLVAFNGSRLDEPEVTVSVAMINAIREGMLHDHTGFSLLYQPMFSPLTGRPVGAEALLRWKDDRFGRVLPLTFLAEIEHDPAFLGLGYWILRNAMQDGLDFVEADPEFRVFSNISPSQLDDAYFADNVAEIARDVGFPLRNLCIELNRECRYHPLETLRSFTLSLRSKGVRVGIDDFGRGNAWLKTFGEIGPDFIKFGNGLVRNIAGSKKDLSILSHLSAMTDECGAEVFVKGVENAETLEALKGMPILGIQGEFLSAPIYFDEVLDRI